MSFDDETLVEMHRDLFAAFGIDAVVARGAATQDVRIVVDRDQAQLGEYGQVVARLDEIQFQVEQWQPKGGDILTWTDRLGLNSKRVDRILAQDGFVSRVVLHG